jgi:hypothetical protein
MFLARRAMRLGWPLATADTVAGWLPASGGGEEVRAPLMDFLTPQPRTVI